MNVDDLLPLVKGSLLKRLGNGKYLAAKNLLEKLADDLAVHPHDVRRVFIRLVQDKWISGVADDGRPFTSVRVIGERPEQLDPDSLIQWRGALKAAGVPSDVAALMEEFHSALTEFGWSDLLSLAGALLAMREALQTEPTQAQFVTSARHLLSSSKLAGQLPRATLRAFCPQIEQQAEQIPYLVTAGPTSPESVILIENPWAFERALEAGLAERHALVVTFGYGLNRNSEAFGRQLAGMVEAGVGGLIQLRRSGQPPDLNVLFTHPRLSFWGDLDPEGLRIFLRLRVRLPQLELSTLYKSMLSVLKSGGGHPYLNVTGKAGQIPIGAAEVASLGRELQDLAACCALRGVDQEALSIEQLQYALADQA